MISNRITALIFVSLISLRFIFKTHLEELKGVSYFFLGIVFLLISLLLVELLQDKGENMETFDEITSFKADYHVLTAVSIFIFAYSNQFMVFPAYAELENRSTVRFAWTTFYMGLIYTTALVSTAIIAVLLFGNKLEPDLLENLVMRSGKVSVFMRIAYSFILLLHLQYYFFAIKEYCLVTYDELVNKSISALVE